MRKENERKGGGFLERVGSFLLVGGGPERRRKKKRCRHKSGTPWSGTHQSSHLRLLLRCFVGL